MIEVQDWYEGEAAGLGRPFRHAIDALVGRISANPTQFSFVHYSLFFVTDGDNLIVIACFHASRSPIHWRSRS